MSIAFEEISNYVDQLTIINTHEHLPYCEDAREKETDVLKEYFLMQYFNSDLISAGLKREDYVKACNHKLPQMESWKLIEPYWEFAKNTGYGRSLQISARGLYGIDKIGKSTIEQLNESFISSLKPGHFQKVLQERNVK